MIKLRGHHIARLNLAYRSGLSEEERIQRVVEQFNESQENKLNPTLIPKEVVPYVLSERSLKSVAGLFMTMILGVKIESIGYSLDHLKKMESTYTLLLDNPKAEFLVAKSGDLDDICADCNLKSSDNCSVSDQHWWYKSPNWARITDQMVLDRLNWRPGEVRTPQEIYDSF